jgi:peptidoglycan/xylan/chitin deacetylase (PgdA/CDA1 family)
MPFVCFSFDVEEWDSPSVFGVESPHSLSTRFSAEGCRNIIDLFARYGVKTTFFVTGVFARNHPDVVRGLVDAGHEVACHGDAHKDLSNIPYDELKTEVEAGLRAVESAALVDVVGFRSPRNLVNPNLYRVLSELGFKYDSSVHPAVLPGHLFGFLGRGDVHLIGGVVEVPMSTLFGLPISWWWMRNIGVWYTRVGCEWGLRLHKYALLYFHPWEFTTLPKVKGLPKHMTSGTGQEALVGLERMLVSFKKRGCSFATVSEIASSLSSRR